MRYPTAPLNNIIALVSYLDFVIVNKTWCCNLVLLHSVACLSIGNTKVGVVRGGGMFLCCGARSCLVRANRGHERAIAAEETRGIA